MNISLIGFLFLTDVSNRMLQALSIAPTRVVERSKASSNGDNSLTLESLETAMTCHKANEKYCSGTSTLALEDGKARLQVSVEPWDATSSLGRSRTGLLAGKRKQIIVPAVVSQPYLG